MAYIVTHDVINEQGFMKLHCFKLPRSIVQLVAYATSFAYNSIKSRLLMTTSPLPASPKLSKFVVPLDRTLTYRLHQLHKLTDMDSQSVYPERTGLSMSDGRCLTTIGTFEPLSVKELADKANLNKGQASRAAQALVDQGLVLKADHPGDGRGVVLTLTPAGREVFERAMAMIHQRNQEIFGCLSDKEQASLSALFDRLISHARPR
jgi:DNA-binding MarR family transcriptional regulator